MSLKAFHVVFVSCSSLLAFLFGGWAFAQGGVGSAIGGVIAVLVAIGLIVYGVLFWKKITTPEEERRRRRKILRAVSIVPALLVAFWPRAAHACSVCYGEAEGPMLDAARYGVYLLLGILLAVQAAFVVFFLYLRRRSRQHNGDVRPWWNDLTEAHES